MSDFLIAFSVVVGITSGLVSLYLFVDSRQHPAFRKPGFAFGILTLSMVFIALIVVLIPSIVANIGSNTQNKIASTSQNHTTPTEGLTPTPTLIPTPTLTPTDTPIPSPTATPIPTQLPEPKPGDILFTAKFDGSQSWLGDSSWRIYGNALHCSGQGTVHVPFVVPTVQGQATNYTVRFRATAENDGNFGVDVRIADDGSGGYKIGPSGSDMSELYHISISTGSNVYSTLFDPGLSPHTYEVTVANDSITVKVDGLPVLHATDGTYPAGGNINLYSYIPLYITSFVVVQA